MKRGDICKLANLNAGLNGLRVEVLRKSKITGGYVVKLLEVSASAPAYKLGTEIAVSGYELAD